ncbi:hypothetical protein [Acinetobacter sp. WCHAc060033]|uniref:hypothetical protein n=1 Tax=Acinetobacter sp. WCHAc060033 TaxID=2518624 RepID=UPI001D197482|nr:hypothetical protein [Acinetobacter sp. WCHAc060033]
MYTLSKVNHEERDGLVQQREILLDKLNELQFKLFDKSSPEVVDHVNQLQMERAKQQSLLKQAQAKLNQLEPELENFEEGAEHILLEAISQQDWYGFKNKREIIFDKRTGFLFPNFEFMPHYSLNDWKNIKKNYSPNNIGQGKWAQLYECECNDYGFSNNARVNEFDYPRKFRGNESVSLCGYYSSFGSYHINRNYHLYYIYNFSKNNMSHQVSKSDNDVSNSKILLVLRTLDNTEIADDNPRLTATEKAKIILDFFIEKDWIPNFEPFLEKTDEEDDEDFQERLTQAQQQCDVYNQIFDAYYQRIQLQKKLADLELQLAELPEPEPKNIFTSAFDYQIELKNYDSQIINQSVWKYSQASQQWMSNLLNNIDEWENEHLNLVKNTVELNQELDKKLPVSGNITAEEKHLLDSQLKKLKERLDLGLTPLRTSLINFLSESQQISSNLEQTSSLNGLAQLEHQTRPSFELLAEHTAILCTKTLKKMEWLDQSLDFVKSVVNILRRSAENYLILVDKYQQDLMQIGLENSIESEEVEAWFVEWRRERLTLLKQIQPLLDAGLNNVIDEQTVLDIFSCIEQYQNELDQFYLQKRLGIHTTYAFQPNGHRQEKLEKEQELTKLVHQFMQQLENVIFSTKTTAQKIWLIRFSEVWQNGIVNQITDFLTKEQLIERDDVVQIMSEELRKVQQQNLAACLQDAQSYSDALAQREKDVNTLIFKMRKALMK